LKTRIQSIIIALFSFFFVSAQSCGGLEWVGAESGQERAIIYVHPELNGRYKKEIDQLRSDIEKSSRVLLRIVNNERRIPKNLNVLAIVPSNLAKQYLPTISQLDSSEYLIQSNGSYLILTANDVKDKWAWSQGILRLNQELTGSLWLWPGEVGKHVPAKSKISFCSDKQILVKNHLKKWIYFTAKEKRTEIVDWMNWYGLPVRPSFRGGHAFKNWEGKYTSTNPEIFATQKGIGKNSKPSAFSKFVLSEQSYQNLILQEWRSAGRPNIWNVSPNDGLGFDVSSATRAWDPAWMSAIEDKKLTDGICDLNGQMRDCNFTPRYLRLWSELLATMRKENPKAKLSAYAYGYYRKLDSTDSVPDGLVIELIDEYDFVNLQSWINSGAEVYLRPNWWHMGGAAPFMRPNQEGGFIEDALKKGVSGVSMDALLGYWGVQGVNYYVSTRLIQRPDLTTKKVIEEYASAFEGAEKEILAYLEYVENFSLSLGIPPIMGSRGVQYFGPYKKKWEEKGARIRPLKGSYVIASSLYDDEFLKEARKLLAKASGNSANAEAQLKIDFLKSGLDSFEIIRDYIAGGNATGKQIPSNQKELSAALEVFHVQYVLSQDNVMDRLARFGKL